MDEPTSASVLKDLHADLARKYTIHSTTIERLWRSFDRKKRASCLTAGALNGEVLKNPADESMGNVNLIIPECNLLDIADSGPEFLLNLLRHRATKSLCEQYVEGMGGEDGDHAFIHESMLKNGLRHAEPFHNSFTTFLDDEKYGRCFEILSKHDSVLRNLKPAIRAGLIVPQSVGELIMQRQIYLAQTLNILIEDILDQGSTSHKGKEKVVQSKKLAPVARPEQSHQKSSSKHSLQDLSLEALDQRTTCEEYVYLLWTEPSVLARAVNVEFFTRPELMADERGRRLPLHTDKYINVAFLETICKASKATTIWNYINRLLTLLENFSKSKVYRTLLLQELSNVCQLEYIRAQAVFKRRIQTGTGSKYFQRLSGNSGADGSPRINMKQQPETLTREDPQLCYILYLCHAKTNASESVQWLEKLGNLHQSHPLERERLEEREIDALYDLIYVVEFTKDLSRVFSVPSFSRSTGQTFISQSQDLETKLKALKNKVDLSDFALPIDQLLESENAQNALERLDQLVIEMLGLNIQSLHQNLVSKSCEALEKSYQQVLKSTTQNKETVSSFVTATSQSAEKPTVERKEKQKSRPSQSTTSEPEPQSDQSLTKEPSLPQRITVRSSTTKVFSNIFNKSQERGSVNWDDFVTAMADVGFSVVPKYGSVITFYPPDSMEVQRPLTLHRPHKSELEGYNILILSRRLKRVYAWDEDTFVEA